MQFVQPPVPEQMPPLPPGGPIMELNEADELVQFRKAHMTSIGSGITVAVLDTGCNTAHRDFADVPGRIAACVNCTGVGSGDDVTDGSGHGTHVTGALAANGIHVGVAPGCRIVPIKVLDGVGAGQGIPIGEAIALGLQWVIDNADAHDICVVSMSIGDAGNHTDDSAFSTEPIAVSIAALADRNIPVVASSGNYYGRFSKAAAAEGMCFPAILRQAISVGAVYDERCDPAQGRPCRLGEEYGSPEAFGSRPDQVTVYTQRMHKADLSGCGTDFLAPGSWVRATGISGDNGSSVVKEGTSQAAPIVAGTIALMQAVSLERTGNRRPPIDRLKAILRQTARQVNDNAVMANVKPTNRSFVRINAFEAVRLMNQTEV